MLVTAFDSVAGHTIGKTLGLVRASAQLMCKPDKAGADPETDLESSGGIDLDEAKERATDVMRRHARAIGADAIVRLRFEITELPRGNYMVMVRGAAVRAIKSSMATSDAPEEIESEDGPVLNNRCGSLGGVSSLRH